MKTWLNFNVLDWHKSVVEFWSHVSSDNVCMAVQG